MTLSFFYLFVFLFFLSLGKGKAKRKRKRKEKREKRKEKREKREREERGKKTPPCVDSKRLRVYVQDFSVCTGDTPACVQHAGVLPVHTEAS